MTDLFEQFWDNYPYRVSKGIAIKSFEKVIKEHGNEILEKIISAIQAQKRYRNEAKTSGEFIPNWKMPATWLNQQCWLDEIPSHAELKEKTNSQICSFDDCNKPVIGDRYAECETHYVDKHCDFSDHKTYLKKNNLWITENESLKQWRDRCRTHLEKTGFSKWLKNVSNATNKI